MAPIYSFVAVAAVGVLLDDDDEHERRMRDCIMRKAPQVPARASSSTCLVSLYVSLVYSRD